MSAFIDITPENHRCAVTAACPGISKNGDGQTYRITGNLIKMVADGEGAEATIETSASMLEEAISRIQSDHIKRQSARISDLEQALDMCATGGNHLANYLLHAVGANFARDYPSGSNPYDISAAFGPSNEADYDVWCCWDAIMRARATLRARGAGE